MIKFLSCYICILLFVTASTAQVPAGDEGKAPAPASGSTVLHTGTQLVVVDVVARDKDGHPIHGLTREDFVLSEDKAPQPIRNFEEHTADTAVGPAAPLPPQPPGVFTNYTPVPANGVLNVLLLDTLNTPTKDQAYARTQLQQFIKKAAPGTRIAIFGLTTRLYFLQGFTSDPTILKDVVDHRLNARASVLLADPTGNNSDSTSATAAATSDGLQPGTLLTTLTNFEAEQQAFQTRMRMEYTLDAFNVLGHYLNAFPGRKNVIWFSGSFPLDIVPDPTIPDPFAVMTAELEDEYHQTTNLLARSEVAVYPVDARGLMSDPSIDPAHSGAGYATNPRKFSTDMGTFFGSQAEEHATMMAIASDTGGEASFNTNDLASAVSKAINSGSNFYTLTYSPSNHNEHGEYRSIKVQLSPAANAKGITLSYRQGYFADDLDGSKKNAETATVKGATVADRPTYSYASAAMSRGAPMPSDIIFRARVLPASTTAESELAPDNQPNPKASFKGPYRRYDIDISAPGDNFAFMVQHNGTRTGEIAFLAYVFDSDGKQLNAIGKSVQLHQNPEEHKKFIESKVGYHLEVSAPANGESYIRIGVHDLTTNTFGVVEVPTSSVIHLPPPVYPSRK